VTTRREQVLDAAITLLGTQGVRGVTHRAGDETAGLPAGSTSHYFRTREALYDAVVVRFAERERRNWEDIALAVVPTTPAELAAAFAKVVLDSVGPHRTLTLARYALLVEAAQRPALRAQLLATGSRVSASFTNWIRSVGFPEPERHAPIIMNYCVGLVLHELSNPDPAFDPLTPLGALVAALVRPE
jgi:DNA-binding transcriptional regulator YbjK